MKAECTNGFYTSVSLDNRLKPPCGFVSERTRSYLLFLPKEPVVFAPASSLSQNALEISSLLEVIVVNFEECEAPRNRILNLQRFYRPSSLQTFRQNNIRVTVYFIVTNSCF